MSIATTLTAAGGQLLEAASGRRSTAELLLAYLVWGVGLAFFFGPLGDLVGGTGTASVSLFLLVYPLLIQLPLLIHYDRRLGFTARPHLRMRFFGSRLFHPVVVYGLFFLLWIWVTGLLTGVWGPLATEDDPLGQLIGLVFLAGIGIFALIGYFPLVTLTAYLLKGGQLAVRRASRALGSDAGEEESRPGGTDDAGLQGDESTVPGTPGETGADTEPAEGTAGDDPGSDHDRPPEPEAGGDTTADSPNVRFVSLLGLVVVPIGAGWYTGRPEAGISVASLFLTVYEMSYKSGESESATDG
ncbi:MAG: hypothetical protein ABEH66_01175 [Halobacteriales archaeon]